MRNTYSIYSIKTGLFTGEAKSCSSEHLENNIQDGFSCIIGEYDHLSKAIDLSNGQVIEYKPEKPADGYEWDESIRRWKYIKTDDDVAIEVRLKRDKLLQDSDWATLRAIDNGEKIPDSWKEYRSKLRNITKQEGFPNVIDWPTEPKRGDYGSN